MHVGTTYSTNTENNAVRGRFSPFLFKGINFSLGGLHLHVNPDAAALPLDDGLVDVWILFQYVKDHFCIVEVVAMNVGSLALQVSGIRYAPDSGVQSLRAIPAIDVDGSPDSVS